MLEEEASEDALSEATVSDEATATEDSTVED